MMTRIEARTVALAIFLTSLTTQLLGQIQGYNTAKITIKNRTYVGFPMAHDGKNLALLRRDGRLTTLPVTDTSVIKTVSKKFVPYSSDKIRASLVREFGKKYKVSVTSNFVVVHPPGDFTFWAMPFEELFQRFKDYFSSRGLRPNRPKFPMVAVVLRNRHEFDRFLKAYHQLDKNVLGYYSPTSNRIITYDPSDGKSRKKNWAFESTLIHEAVHQSAYNTGIHSRFGQVPRWIPEGLAMMFEAKGVNNSNRYSSRKHRINRVRLSQLKRYYEQRQVQGKIDDVIASDNMFRSDPSRAYAIAWGLTFYLAETHPEKYFKFLKRDSDRQDFSYYVRRDRVRDFAKVFGTDFKKLDKNMEKFITKL